MIASSTLLRNLPKASTLSVINRTGTKACFSSDCAPALKLKSVFEEYRQEHFSRELPSRFRKEIVKVIQGPDQQVTIDNFNIILSNIGRKDAFLSESELNDLQQAAGAPTRKIPVEQAMQLL